MGCAGICLAEQLPLDSTGKTLFWGEGDAAFPLQELIPGK